MSLQAFKKQRDPRSYKPQNISAGPASAETSLGPWPEGCFKEQSVESPAEPRVHLGEGKLFLQNCCFQLDAAWSLKEAAWSTWPLMRFRLSFIAAIMSLASCIRSSAWPFLARTMLSIFRTNLQASLTQVLAAVTT